jgi:hypothetical protein
MTLAAEFDVMRQWLAGEADAALPEGGPSADVAARFGLDPFARAVLVLGAFAALEPDAQAAVAQPTLGLALAALPGANWQAVAPGAPLRRFALIEVARDAAGPAAQYFAVAEPVLYALVGAPSLGTDSAAVLAPLAPPGALAPNRARLAGEIARRADLPGDPVLSLLGPDAAGKHAAFATAHPDRPGFALPTALLPALADMPGFARHIARDLALMDGRLLLDHDDFAEARPAEHFAALYAGPLAVASRKPLRAGARQTIRLDLDPPTADELLPVWGAALAPVSARLNGTAERLADTFRTLPETAQTIGAELAALAPGLSDAALADSAWDACRRAARPGLDDLAERVGSRAGWDDLILPADQIDTLKAIAAQVRHRRTVYDSWGFGDRLAGRGLGVTALFSGPSGAGKTMAGEVLGRELRLDVYRVDLSAMVSKWIGETEKNLSRVFDAAEDGGVILQFDEADALFGKRSEVREAQDRHANIEVSYLLQRLEAYRGLCVLTTNLRENIDDAFLRRLRFVIDFRFPGPVERRAIWARVFPEAAPTDGLDPDRLAGLNVAGGTIRNIAVLASFLAAEDGRAIGMDHVARAARTEYAKSGRIMTEAEERGLRT